MPKRFMQQRGDRQQYRLRTQSQIDMGRSGPHCCTAFEVRNRRADIAPRLEVERECPNAAAAHRQRNHSLGRSGPLISVVTVIFTNGFVFVETKNTGNTLLRWVAKDTTSKAQSGNEVVSAEHKFVEFLLSTRSPLRCGLGCRRVEVVFGPGRQARHSETAVERHVRIDACIETLISERPRGQGGIGERHIA